MINMSITKTERIGEVTETSTREFITQCYELYNLPPLGSLVKAGDPPVYGVVYNSLTCSIEPGRRPIARGQNEESEEALFRHNPQLLKLLKSEFTSLTVGYRDGGKIVHSFPPKPLLIHSFVYLCSPEEVKELSKELDFLNILVSTHLPVACEEITSACLKLMADCHEDRHAFLVKAGKKLTVLLRGNFSELRIILERIE